MICYFLLMADPTPPPGNAVDLVREAQDKLFIHTVVEQLKEDDLELEPKGTASSNPSWIRKVVEEVDEKIQDSPFKN